MFIWYRLGGTFEQALSVCGVHGRRAGGGGELEPP
jgi:hypothetical protein